VQAAMKKLFSIFFLFFWSFSIFGEATKKDVAIAVGDVFAVNLLFNSAARIILQEDYSDINLSTMNDNLHSKWVWDEDGFFMNQFGHPYQGSLYFTSGRSNNLNFWQSFFLTAFGSFTWEEFGETTTPAINDIITTSICGSIFGEALHRIFLDVNEICPPFAWILSPVDALNNTLKGKKTKVTGHIEELDFITFLSYEKTRTEAENMDSDLTKKTALAEGLHLQYGNPVAHTTAEPFDLFTADASIFLSYHYFKFDFFIDGFLYSHALYFENSEGTLGINLMYEGEKSTDIILSTGAVGVKYIGSQQIFNSTGILGFFSQLDFIFMGTRSLYYLYDGLPIGSGNFNPIRSYNFTFGPLFKGGFSVEQKKYGKIFGEAEFNYTVPYPGSKLEEVKGNKHLIFIAKFGYEYNFPKYFTIGIDDSVIFKADWFDDEASTQQLVNSAKIYVKVRFERKKD